MRHALGRGSLVAALAVAATVAGPLAAAPALATGPVPVETLAPSTLTLVAHVVDDDGGEAAPGDWTLDAAGPTSIGGASGDAAVTAALVAPGSYALAVRGRSGYVASAWGCTDGELAGDVVSVASGRDVVCTVVLDDRPVDLAATVQADAAAVATGGTVAVTLGVHNVGARDVDLDEPVTATIVLPPSTTVTAVAGGCAASGATVSCSIDPAALPVGGAVPLSIALRVGDGARPGTLTTLAAVSTEDDPAPAAATCGGASNNVACAGTELRRPTITLRQVLVTDDGGDAGVADFSLSATGAVAVAGTSGSTAVTAAPVPPGTYRLGASGPAGYRLGSWSCTGGSLDGTTLTIAGPVDVTCTIGADDRAVDLQVAGSGGEVVAAGAEARFSLTVRNVGGRGVDDDEPVTLTDALPAGLSFVAGPAGCTAAGRAVACVIEPAALAAGAAVTIELRVAVAADAVAGTVVSRATVGTDDDPAPAAGCERPSDGVVCLETRVFVGSVTARTSVHEQVHGAWLPSDGAVGFGDRVQFRIVVRAEGEAPSTGVSVVDRLPEGLLVDGIARCSVACTVALDPATATQRIEIGRMMPGQVVTITIEARVPGVPSQADGTTVRVSFDSAPSLSSDNVAEVPTNVVTVRASHALPAARPSGGEIPIGGIGVSLALLVAGGLLLVRSREKNGG